MIQATGTGDLPPGDETGSDADAPPARPAEPDDDTADDTADDTDSDHDAVPEQQQPDRYQPL
ncbi:MAG TPA: hypothetical protein VGL05_08980 [Kribbella sp.]